MKILHSLVDKWQARLAIIVFGAVLTTGGWFFDKATVITPLMWIVHSDYYYAMQTIDDLSTDPQLAALPDDPGFRALLDRWPNLERRADVAAIGRSIAYLEFGPEITPNFALVTYDKDEVMIQNNWRVSDARRMFAAEANQRLLYYSAVPFYIGLILSTGMAVFEVLRSRSNTGSSQSGDHPPDRPTLLAPPPRVGPADEGPVPSTVQAGKSKRSRQRSKHRQR